ncbi:MAG: AEC family transporter [Faecousia sp.]
MDKWSAVAQVVVPIFAAVALGVFSRRKGLLSPEGNQGLQQFVMKFGMPCVLFNSTLTASLGTEALITMTMLVPLMLFSTLTAFFLRSRRLRMHNFPMLFAAKETGMIGIPLFITLFGASQAFRMGVLDIAQALIAIPVISFLAADPGDNPTPAYLAGRVIRSPLLIMSVLGLGLNLTGAANVLKTAGILPVITETTGFLAQSVSSVMLFSVGYSFSLSRENRALVLKLSAAHLAVFAVFCAVMELVLTALPRIDSATKWAVLLYTALPASYIAPTLGRTSGESAVASGVCSLLTAVCLGVFCVMAVILA